MHQLRRYPLGVYRGLAFGLALHAGGAAEVFLEGKATRHGLLSRDHRGPRAVLNAVDRLAGTLPRPVRHHPPGPGNRRRPAPRPPGPPGPFLRPRRLPGRADGLRDQLKAGLSQATPEPGTPTVAELAESIKALKAAHTIDAAPERTTSRRIVGEEPVTARIHRRALAEVASEPPPEPASPPVEILPAVADTPARAEEPPPPAAIAHFPNGKPIASARPQSGYRQHVASTRRQDARQLSLF